MDLIVKRKKCGSSFDRSAIGNYNGAPEEEVHATIDRVELATDGFRFVKRSKRCWMLFATILILCLVGAGVKKIVKLHSRGALNRGWCGTRAADQSPAQFPGQTTPAGPVPAEAADKPQGGPHRRNGQNGFGGGHHGHKRGEKPQQAPEKRPAPEPLQKPTGPLVDPNPNLPQPPADPNMPKVPQPPAVPELPKSSPVSDPDAPVSSEPSLVGEEPAAPAEPRRHNKWGHWFRRHDGHGPEKKRKCKKIFFAFLIGMPLFIILSTCCLKRRAFRKVKKLLEIENRIFRMKYGCEWTVDRHLTELTLRKIGAHDSHRQVQLTAFPRQNHQAMPVHHPQPMVFHQHQTPYVPEQAAPFFTERMDTEHQPLGSARGGYQRVSLDDSSLVYK